MVTLPWRALPPVSLGLSILSLLFSMYWLSRNLDGGPGAVFSYRGHDHPPTIPLALSLQSVLLTVEESRNYRLEGYKSDSVWEALGGDAWGYIRLKSDSRSTRDNLDQKKRMFVVTMFHELHCLRLLNLAFDESHVVGEHHITHCLNYLRQMALCDSDLTLESYDWEERHGGEDVTEYSGEFEGATHVCRDWTEVSDLVQNNWEEWVREQSTTNVDSETV